MVAESMSAEWDKQITAQDSVLDLMNNNLTNIAGLDFSNIEMLK